MIDPQIPHMLVFPNIGAESWCEIVAGNLVGPDIQNIRISQNCLTPTPFIVDSNLDKLDQSNIHPKSDRSIDEIIESAIEPLGEIKNHRVSESDQVNHLKSDRSLDRTNSDDNQKYFSYPQAKKKLSSHPNVRRIMNSTFPPNLQTWNQ